MWRADKTTPILVRRGKMKTRLVMLMALIVLVSSCEANYSGYSTYSTYTGFSSYFKKTTGTSNLTSGYKDPPVLDANVPLAKFEFQRSAEEYLASVVNDLKEVNEKADNATEKIDAVVDAVNFGLEFFHVRYVGSAIILRRESNFGIFGYPEFDDFDYFPPTKPYKPLFLDTEFAIDSYNSRVRSYNREVDDFAETVEAYIEDAKHYIENCRNDYDEIRQKGLYLLSYIESLGMNAEEAVADIPPYGLHRNLMKPIIYDNAQQPKIEMESTTKVATSDKVIKGYRMKRDSLGNFARDKDGNFIFIPVYEDEQQK